MCFWYCCQDSCCSVAQLFLLVSKSAWSSLVASWMDTDDCFHGNVNMLGPVEQMESPSLRRDLPQMNVPVSNTFVHHTRALTKGLDCLTTSHSKLSLMSFCLLLNEFQQPDYKKLWRWSLNRTGSTASEQFGVKDQHFLNAQYVDRLLKVTKCKEKPRKMTIFLFFKSSGILNFFQAPLKTLASGQKPPLQTHRHNYKILRNITIFRVFVTFIQ